MLPAQMTSFERTCCGLSNLRATQRMTEARWRFWKRLKREKSKRARFASMLTESASCWPCCCSATPANWWMVGNCRLKLVAVRITPSISKSCSAVYSPSQTKMYFSASQVWISLYLLATKSAAMPSSWKLALLMRVGSQTSTKSTICAQMCMVSCISWNLRPTCSSHRSSTRRISALTARPPPWARAIFSLISVRKAASRASMWVRMEARQGWSWQRGVASSSSMRATLATGAVWLVRSAPKKRSFLWGLSLGRSTMGAFWVLEVEGRFLSFMEQFGQAALFFISILLYFKFMRMLLIWSLVILLEPPRTPPPPPQTPPCPAPPPRPFRSPPPPLRFSTPFARNTKQLPARGPPFAAAEQGRVRVRWRLGWIFLQFKVITVMAEYDYEEAIMGEMVPSIRVPVLQASAMSEREGSAGGGVLEDLERLMQEERAGEERRVQALKEKQQHISEQVGRRLAEKERKIRELEEQQKRRLYSECTFKPKTSHQKGEKRSLNEFLHQQDQFTRKVAQKRTTLKNTLDSKHNAATFHPKINRARPNDKPAPDSSVFERLYALKDKENTEDNQQEGAEEFHPRITDKSKRLTRNAPIDNLLYNDALRRQERAREVEALNVAPGRQERQLNLNNQKYVAQKFIKEYFGVMERLSVPASAQAKIEYVLFNEILKEMGFAGVEEEGENTLERTLVHEAYQTLERYQVNAKNICVFLLAIIGVYHINPVNFQEGEASSPETEFALDEPEGRKLQKYFDLFKRNRLFGEAARKEAEKEQREAAAQQAQQQHHPRINKASEELAERYREQMLQEVNQLLENYPELDYSIPADGVISHTDLLVLNNLARELKQQQRKEEASKKQLEECTFKPATLPNSMHNSTISSGEGGLGHKKSLELYNYHRNLQSKKESLRLSRQNQDAELKECTFAPTLNHAKVNADTRNYHTKQVEETLYRMKKGRHDREEKQKFLERGERSKKEAEYFSLKEKPPAASEPEEAPTLLLDVNLGEKMDRITLYPGDEHRLEEIAGEFAARHGLDEENREKLCQLLRIQLESVLMKIEEDEESEIDQ